MSFTCLFGDAVEKMKEMHANSVNLILTDPPFAVISDSGRSRNNELNRHIRSYADFIIMDKYFMEFSNEVARLLTRDGRLLLFCDCISYPLFFACMYSKFDYVRALIWYKGDDHFSLGLNQAFRYSYEMILHGYYKNSYFEKKDRKDVIKHHVVPIAERSHPAQNPLALVKDLILATTRQGDMVLDPFMGSGTTLRAAILSGRRCIGIEANETLCKEVAEVLAQTSRLDIEVQG